jgi:hypothetical protein
MILTVAFLSLEVWLTHIMSSLCRKPKLITFLFAILYTANIISHIQLYERRLKKSRINKSNPKNKLIEGNNIWNLCVIDNIDFKEKHLHMVYI